MPRDTRKQVREPVQVYLARSDRKLLREVAAAAGVSGAEILRRGLRRMAGEVLGEQGPAMRLLQEMNSADWPEDMPVDAALRHDHHVADAVYPAPRRTRRGTQ
jgi:hypothetical protein